MVNPQLGPMLRQLRRLAGTHAVASLSDADLLARFIHQRDEAAFEVLVWRHGPAVLSLCRRLLRHGPDAEDAFQATFLALVQKGGSVKKGASVGGWLYKVAYRVALAVRARERKRARHERPFVDGPASPIPEDTSDLALLLQDEVDRLPEKYRLPFVLCYLQGKTLQETAHLLACPFGTVGTRLARARARLRARLTRRGVVLSGAGLAACLFEGPDVAALPNAIVANTVRAAVAGTLAQATATGAITIQTAFLTQGVLKAMFLSKLKVVATVLLAVSIAGTSAGVLSYRTLAAGPAETATPRREATENARAKALEDQLARAQAQLEKAELQLQQMALDVADFRAHVQRLKDQIQIARQPGAQPADEPRGAVAYIYGTQPITREELGEYLIARFGASRLESLVNQRIIERACRDKGITVTDAEVEAGMAEEIRAQKITREEFVNKVLKARQKTLYEWKQDVIRPSLLLAKYCRDRIRVTNADVRRAYEATYGAKVECRMIAWPRDERKDAAEWQRFLDWLHDDAEAFDHLARRQFRSSLAATGGQLPPIGRYTTGNEELEQIALALQPGEISSWIDTPDGRVILKCIKRIPADASKSLAQVREQLGKEVRGKKLMEAQARVFAELRKQAQPRLILKP